ncbi:MAG: SpoIID/LytB domain-containing protein [Candidatus Omnitrophica bacterium]|nr:SpoIID/LytB domain-containing protein [Candidatus Omnitrophota bacterium]
MTGRALLLAGAMLAGLLPTAAAEPPAIRVAVVQDQPEVALAVHGRFRITALRTPDALQEGARLPTVVVRAAREGIAIGGQVLPQPGVRVEPARDATIDLNGRRLRGVLEILAQPDQTLLVVNHIELEDYLQGVLSKEAPFYWPIEALKALAIAARTYTVFQQLSKTSLAYDVSGDVMSQVYGGRGAERGRSTRAVGITRGLVLTFEGKVFPAFYHSTCGGLTEEASVMGPFDLAPLKGGVACSFCVESPFYRWQRRLSDADVAWAVQQAGRGSVWPVQDVDILAYSPTGRVGQVRIRGGGRVVDVAGYEFRKWFGFDRVRSTGFAILREPEGFILQGRGWGHGVGLCQWGAAALARRGLSAKEILAYYYPEAELVRLGEHTMEPIPVKKEERPRS